MNARLVRCLVHLCQPGGGFSNADDNKIRALYIIYISCVWTHTPALLYRLHIPDVRSQLEYWIIYINWKAGKLARGDKSRRDISIKTGNGFNVSMFWFNVS